MPLDSNVWFTFGPAPWDSGFSPSHHTSPASKSQASRCLTTISQYVTTLCFLLSIFQLSWDDLGASVCQSGSLPPCPHLKHLRMQQVKGAGQSRVRCCKWKVSKRAKNPDIWEVRSLKKKASIWPPYHESQSDCIGCMGLRLALLDWDPVERLSVKIDNTEPIGLIWQLHMSLPSCSC